MTARAIAMGQCEPVTMTSREIAELTGKEHKHVLRDIRVMLAELALPEQGYAQNWANPQNGQSYPMLSLPKGLTITLVSGYSVAMRHRIVTRWQELEAQAETLNRFNLPKTHSAALRLAADEMEKREIAEAALALAVPKVAVHDRIADAEGSISIREAANTLRVPERKFVLWLQQHDWCYRRAGHKSLLGYAEKIKAGYLYLKQTPVTDDNTGQERLREQVRITPQGLTVLARNLAGGLASPAPHVVLGMGATHGQRP